MTTSTVLVDRDEHVGIITLNRPEVLNALNAQLGKELDQAIADLEQDTSIHVIVVTGAGRAFSAGADIKEMAQREQQPDTEGSRAGSNYSLRLAFCAKPTIAALNGLAIGGGALLSSVPDMRFGCEKSQFRFPGAAYGRINATWTLALILGLPKAKELLFSGRMVEAEEALSMGLLNRLVPSDRLMQETMEFAHSIAASPPNMIQGVKELLHDYIGMRFPDMSRLEQEMRENRLPAPPAQETFKDFLGSRDRQPRT